MEYKVECSNCNSINLDETEYVQGAGVGFECLDCGNRMSLRDIQFREIDEDGVVVVKLKIENLERCFVEAQEQRSRYVGVKIQMAGFEEPEIIINPMGNFENKLAYYKKAYNEDLTLKSFDGIKIIEFTHGDRYDDIEDELIF